MVKLYTLRPTCVNWKVFENNLAAIHEKKISLTLNKPIYVRFTESELSKLEMYSVNYDFMKKKFKDVHYSLTLVTYVMNAMKILAKKCISTATI